LYSFTQSLNPTFFKLSRLSVFTGSADFPSFIGSDLLLELFLLELPNLIGSDFFFFLSFSITVPTGDLSANVPDADVTTPFFIVLSPVTFKLFVFFFGSPRRIGGIISSSIVAM